MTKLQTVLSAAVLGVVVIIAGVLLNSRFAQSEPDIGAANAPVNSVISTSADVVNRGQDVVGTHVGTTTVGVASAIGASQSISVTTTYVSKIGRNIDTAIYNIKMVSVQSTTLNSLYLTVEGSNDGFCDTQGPPASSTTDVVKQDINWYSAMDHLKGKVHATSFGNASTTAIMSWINAAAGYGQQIILTDLNYECLRLGVSGVSTTPYINLITK